MLRPAGESVLPVSDGCTPLTAATEGCEAEIDGVPARGIDALGAPASAAKLSAISFALWKRSAGSRARARPKNWSISGPRSGAT